MMTEVRSGTIFRILILWIICEFLQDVVLAETIDVMAANFLQKSRTKDQEQRNNEHIVYPRLYHLSRRRRYLSDEVDEIKSDAVVVIRLNNFTIYVDLSKNSDMTSGDFSVTVRHEKGREEVMTKFPQLEERPCLFHGRIVTDPGGVAAISTCGGDGNMVGALVTSGGRYSLQPWSEKENDEKYFPPEDGATPHLLFRAVDESQEFCGVDFHGLEPELYVEEEGYTESNRVRRADRLGRKVIQTAVFVDSHLYNSIAQQSRDPVTETVNRVLGIMNQVQLIYNYGSLKTKFKLVIVKMEILKPGVSAPNTSGGNIDRYLDNFCTWQARLNRRERQRSQWDHAIMLTGLDLYKADKGRRNEKVLGLAWVNGMCRANYSCTLNEGASFEAAYVIAHEMAHNLGIQHDGSGNNCNPDKYLMSDKTGPGKVNWSPCSNAYLQKFFSRGYGQCLEDDANPTRSSLDLDVQNLPGERFSLTTQCKLALGSDYRPHQASKAPFNNVCRELWCASGLWAKPAHPALEGSSCETGKKCYEGQCRVRREALARQSEDQSSGSWLRRVYDSLVERIAG